MNAIIQSLIPILILIESGGNPNAAGDGGKAIGCLQIHACVVQDVNRIAGTAYAHQDAEDPRKARRICSMYLAYWGKRYERRTGLTANHEALARIWNGGPNGWKKQSTLPYWAKVRERWDYKHDGVKRKNFTNLLTFDR